MSTSLADRAYRNRALGKYGYQCYWCGRKLVAPRDIPPRKVISHGRKIVVWRADNKIKWGWQLTFDHVKPRSMGGKTRNNIVPCCYSCNMVRGKYTHFYLSGKPRRNTVTFIKQHWTNKIRPYQMARRASKKVASLAEKTR